MTDTQSQSADNSLEHRTVEIVNMLSNLRPEIKQMVQRHLDSRIRGRVDASDIVQSTFIDARKRVERFVRDQPMPVRQWLFYLAKMKTLETNHYHLRVKKRDARLEKASVPIRSINSDHSTPSQRVVRKETNHKLSNALQQLPYRYQLVIQLRHFQGRSNKQVGDYLEITEKAASKLYIRALQKLRSQMSSHSLD